MAQPQTAQTGQAREYETIYVLRPDVTPENARKIAARVEEAVARENGKLTLVETWGRRVLAYAVGRHKRGLYVYLRYLGHGSVVSEIERNLRMFDDVLKYQTIVLRGGLSMEAAEIDPENVKFEDIEPQEEIQEESLERILGLEPPNPERDREREREEYRASSAAAAAEGEASAGEDSAGDEQEDEA
jgi:small subunit ribosomal protein S6